MSPSHPIVERTTAICARGYLTLRSRKVLGSADGMTALSDGHQVFVVSSKYGRPPCTRTCGCTQRLAASHRQGSFHDAARR